ncbi:hypothetical protein QM012_005515 [Aureobasidium pullulans]|uniref:Uncharacterized protein n=1 Tax=Aureobasidium pullulans TaxID=5580 RepID=A0ABR0T5R7_AURPU
MHLAQVVGISSAPVVDEDKESNEVTLVVRDNDREDIDAEEGQRAKDGKRMEKEIKRVKSEAVVERQKRATFERGLMILDKEYASDNHLIVDRWMERH